MRELYFPELPSLRCNPQAGGDCASGPLGGGAASSSRWSLEIGLSHLRRWAVGTRRAEQTARAYAQERGHERMQTKHLAVLSVGEVPVRWSQLESAVLGTPENEICGACIV